MAKMRVAQVPRPNGPFELVERDIFEPPAAGCESRCRPAVSVTASQVDGRKMMARRIVYGLFPGVAILLAVGTALGQGVQTFTNEQGRGGIARPTASCGSTHQQRIIILKTTLGMSHAAR
jgi:hypothetical protein